MFTQFSLPEEVQGEQETWFESNNDVFVEEILTWLNESGISQNDSDVDQDDKNDDDVGKNAD